MTDFKRLLENEKKAKGQIEIITPKGKENIKAFDCFKILPLTAWAGTKIDPANDKRIRSFAEIEEKIYFAIKTENVKRDRAKLGFELCLYTNDKAFKDLVKRTVVPIIDSILGDHKEEKLRYYGWPFSDCAISKDSIKKVIDALIERVQDD